MAANSDIDPELIVSHKFPETIFTYTERDAALYALGIGACSKSAVDHHDLKYVYHPDGQQFIQVLPTFATLLSYGSFQQLGSVPGLQYDPDLLLHGQHYVEIYKPLPSHGSIVNKASISGLHDKGLQEKRLFITCAENALISVKAAIIETEILSYAKESGQLVCMNRMTCYIRGAGGFSKTSEPFSYSKYQNNQAVAPKIPICQPFAVYEECTQPAQALIYRLSGDYYPLHADPNNAKSGGFDLPILHGLCTLGFAIRAINKCICRGEQNIIKNISNRFLLHVYPGETLLTEMWLEGIRVLFQVKVKERNKAVLAGYVELSRLSSSL